MDTFEIIFMVEGKDVTSLFLCQYLFVGASLVEIITLFLLYCLATLDNQVTATLRVSFLILVSIQFCFSLCLLSLLAQCHTDLISVD